MIKRPRRSRLTAKIDNLLARSQNGDWAAKMNFTWETLVVDLDRCPHGRHMGDLCGGWRGPGTFDGGCRGGTSLGNPMLPQGAIIGTSLGRHFMIRVPKDRYDRADARAWYVPVDEGAHDGTVRLAEARNIEDGLDG